MEEGQYLRRHRWGHRGWRTDRMFEPARGRGQSRSPRETWAPLHSAGLATQPPAISAMPRWSRNSETCRMIWVGCERSASMRPDARPLMAAVQS